VLVIQYSPKDLRYLKCFKLHDILYIHFISYIVLKTIVKKILDLYSVKYNTHTFVWVRFKLITHVTHIFFIFNHLLKKTV